MNELIMPHNVSVKDAPFLPNLLSRSTYFRTRFLGYDLAT